MSEQLKVFKNVHTQTRATTGAPLPASSVILAETGATERAVIKDVSCAGVMNATLDLDGRTVATSTQDLIASGSLIMDTDSVLSLKFPELSLTSPNFKGMFFSNGSDAVNYITGDGIGDGTNTSATTIVNNTTSGQNTFSSFAAYKGDVLTFFRYYSNSIYEYEATSSSPKASYGFGSGCGSCTDGTYMYNIPTGATTTINRRHIVTGVSSNFTSNSTVYGQQGNQGSFLEYHDGHLYSKQEGSASTMYIIKISDGSVTTVSNGALSGSYSDGGCIVTTLAGKSFVVEQGNGQWMWYEIGGSLTQFTKASGGSSASTEYGDGGIEIAPGIAMIFCEQSDDLTIIDMNMTPPTWSHIASATDRKMAVHNAFGSYFSVCGILQGPADTGFTYDAYTSGILITEDV
jgi:hypothetical protein